MSLLGDLRAQLARSQKHESDLRSRPLRKWDWKQINACMREQDDIKDQIREAEQEQLKQQTERARQYRDQQDRLQLESSKKRRRESDDDDERSPHSKQRHAEGSQSRCGEDGDEHGEQPATSDAADEAESASDEDEADSASDSSDDEEQSNAGHGNTALLQQAMLDYGLLSGTPPKCAGPFRCLPTARCTTSATPRRRTRRTSTTVSFP